MTTPLDELTYSGVLSGSLPTPGRIVYNGFEFPIAHRMNLRAQPVYDQAGVSVLYNAYTLSVGCFLTADDEATLAELLQDYSGGGNAGIRKVLTEPGKALTVQECGVGDIVIDPNTAGLRDVAMGPKPLDLTIRPISNLAVEIVWVCQFSLADCLNMDDGTGLAKWDANLLAFNMRVEFVIGFEGLTERVLTGYLQMPQMLGDDRKPKRNIDDYWGQQYFPVPLGFRRATFGRSLAENHQRLDFRIVDQEIPGDDALPPGVIDGNATISVENREASNFHLWTYSLEGSFTSARGNSRAHGYNAAFYLLAQYVNRLRGYALSVNQNIVPEFVRVRRELFNGRRVDFSFSFLVAMPIDQILDASGIFEPVPNSDWNAWKYSMDQLWQPRGFTGLKNQANNTAIVNICAGGLPSDTTDSERNPPAPVPLAPIVSCEQITSQNSWIAYDNHLVGEVYSSATIHTRNNSVRLDVTDNGEDFTRQGNAELGSFPVGASLEIQTHGPPLVAVLMQGSARRVNFKPLVPALQSIDGRPVVEKRRNVTGPKVVGNFGDCQVFETKWSILYLVDVVSAGEFKLGERPSPQP